MGKVRIAAEALSAASLAGIFATVGWHWSSLPSTIPVHFNISGQPDRWGGKEMLLLLALIAAACYAILSFVQRRSHLMNMPFTVDLQNATVRHLVEEMACVLKAGVMLVLLTAIAATIEVARGNANALPSGYLLLVFLLTLGPTVIYLARLRRP